MILVDGDSIVVPAFTSVVTVTGAVNQPTALTYVPGQDINYYIRAAGGGDRRADLGRAYVVQPNGRLQSVVRRRFLPDGLPEPRPGAKIVVPERSPTDNTNIAQTLSLLAQVGGPLAAVVAAIITLRRQ
jgi:protein involved in polysaccharide export with SLBB domain